MLDGRATRSTADARRNGAPIRLQVRPVLRGGLGRLFVGMGAFEFGNCAATLLILRATELLEPGRGQDRAASIAVLLYVAYNVAATLTSLPAGHLGDRVARGSCCSAAPTRSSPPTWCSRAPERACRCSPRGSCSRASGSARPRPQSTPRSRPGQPRRSAAARSGCWPRCRAPATSPRAPSPGSCGRPFPPRPHSSGSPRGCSWPWSPSSRCRATARARRGPRGVACER